MEASDALRQVNELLTLQDQWWYSSSVKINTPALFSRLQRLPSTATGLLEVKKQLSFSIDVGVFHPDHLQDLVLEIEFPLSYPSQSACLVKAVHKSSPGVEWKGCTKALESYLASFVGFECLELLLDWLAENQETCLSSSIAEGVGGGGGEASSSSSNNDRVTCFVLRYNHLLSGPEHKKEKSMLDTAKKLHLEGGLLWGTPGIVICVPPTTEEDAKEYAGECRTIGKRPGGVEEIGLPAVGIEEAGLGGLAQQKRGGRLKELDTAGLRIACGNDEDLVRTVLGVQ